MMTMTTMMMMMITIMKIIVIILRPEALVSGLAYLEGVSMRFVEQHSEGLEPGNHKIKIRNIK